jgi:hypothetical protein
MRGTRSRRVTTASIAVAMLTGILPVGASELAGEGTSPPLLIAREVRTVDAKDFGATRPGGVAYDPAAREFFVAGQGPDGTPLHRLDPLWERAGVVSIPTVRHLASLAFDAGADRLTWIAGDQLVGVSASDLRSSERITSVETLGTVDASEPSSRTIPRTGTSTSSTPTPTVSMPSTTMGRSSPPMTPPRSNWLARGDDVRSQHRPPTTPTP